MSTQPTSPTLLGLSRAEQEAAKRWFVRSRLAHLLTLVFTATALFFDGRPTYFLALAALASEAAAWTYRIRADRRHSLAEEGRRRALLCDAFGTAPGALAIRELRANFSKRAQETASSFEDPNYYDSSAAPGNSRLRDHLQESAFWSSYLYAAAGRAAILASAVPLVLVIVALLIAAGTESGHGALIIARVGVAFLSFLVFSDLVTHALAWADAADKSRDVTRRLEKDSLKDVATALAVYGDYCVATATTPPIPSILYKRNKARIDAAWASAAH
jgi:hypothetical protein